MKREQGQALPIVLVVLLLGVSFITPAIYFANSALISQRIAKEALVDLYSADSCTTYVMWNLLYTPGFSTSPPAEVTCTLNGITGTVGVVKLVASNLVDQTMQTSIPNYAVAANHQIWIIASTNDIQGGGVYLAYDTVGSPSQAKIPWVTAGTKTYYWHNYPTPPAGDTTTPILMPDKPCNSGGTCYDALGMTETASTQQVLYNYDSNVDVFSGRKIGQSNDGAQCANKVTASQNDRIIWRSPTLASADTINGTVDLRWWWAIADQSFGSHDLTMWLCDFNTANPVRDTGSRNPVNVISGSGKLNTGKIPVWVDAFDLRAEFRAGKITSRIDKVSATALSVRSWQWDKVPGQN